MLSFQSLSNNKITLRNSRQALLRIISEVIFALLALKEMWSVDSKRGFKTN